MVSGPLAIFHHKQLCRQFVLRSSTLHPRYLYPMYLCPTQSGPWICGIYGKQNLILQGFNNWSNSPKLSMELLAEQQLPGHLVPACHIGQHFGAVRLPCHVQVPVHKGGSVTGPQTVPSATVPGFDKGREGDCCLGCVLVTVGCLPHRHCIQRSFCSW